MVWNKIFHLSSVVMCEFWTSLIIIQINENKKRKCPSLGEGGWRGGLTPVKRVGKVGVQEQLTHISFPFLFVTGTLTLDSSFLTITELYLFKGIKCIDISRFVHVFIDTPNFSYSIFFCRTFIYLGVQTMWQKLQHRLMTYTSLVWVSKQLVSSLSFFCQDNLTVNTGIWATHSKKLHPSSATQILGKTSKINRKRSL